MIKIEDSKDMRIVILLHLEEKDYALEQKISNEFLSKLTTRDGIPDLGTIRRSLEDLLEEGFIMETHESKVIGSHHLFTSKKQYTETPENYDSKEFSNPQRFISKVGNAPKIINIYLGITLKGKMFLTDRRNSEANQELISHSIDKFNEDRKWFKKPIFQIILGAVLATAGGIITELITENLKESPELNVDPQIDISIVKDSLSYN